MVQKSDNTDEMRQWNSNGLKKWEQFITTYFPVKAHILDVGCGMGREVFALSDMGFPVIFCEKGVIYTPAYGMILH